MSFMRDIATIGVYGFLKNFCPDGFYMSNILLGPIKNFTVVETTQEVYPVLVYSNQLLTLVALLVTDILQYKTLIIVGAMASVLSKVAFYWGNSIIHIQVMQLFYALYKASQVAYRTYIYTKVHKQKYQRVTAVVHITPKMGTLLSAVVAQMLLSSQLVELRNLIQMSIVGLSLALLTAMTLPSVEGTAYSPNPATLSSSPQEQITIKAGQKYKRAARLLWDEFQSASTNLGVIKWCIWWVLATGAFQLVSDYYVQALWNEISGEKLTTYNAGVEAIYACCSSIVCFLIGRFHIAWHLRGEAVFGLCTLIKGTALITCAHSSSLVLAYVLYITVSTLYDMMMVISNSQVALQVKNDSFGLIFGINTFLALAVQSTLTYFLTSKNTFALPIRLQFVAVGSGFLVLGTCYSVKAIYSSTQRANNPNKPSVEILTPISDKLDIRGESERVNV